MEIKLTEKQFRRLLDLVYIGNWILNSTRGDQRFTDYDEVESLVFGRAALEGMPSLAELYQGEIVPSRAFVEGGSTISQQLMKNQYFTQEKKLERIRRILSIVTLLDFFFS